MRREWWLHNQGYFNPAGVYDRSGAPAKIDDPAVRGREVMLNETDEIERLRAALEKTNRPLTLEEIVAKQKDLVLEDYYEYTDGTTSLDKETGNDTD